jgi:hypothetical protein
MIEKEPLTEEDENIINEYISGNSVAAGLGAVATISALLVMFLNPPCSLVRIIFFITASFLVSLYYLVINILTFKKKKEGYKEIKKGVIVEKIYSRNRFAVNFSIRLKAIDNQ